MKNPLLFVMTFLDSSTKTLLPACTSTITPFVLDNRSNCRVFDNLGNERSKIVPNGWIGSLGTGVYGNDCSDGFLISVVL